MNGIHIRKELTSHMLELPELAPLIGRVVEIHVELASETAAGEPSSAVRFTLDESCDLDTLSEIVLQSGALSRLA